MGESDLAVDHFVRLLKGEQGAFLEDFVLAFEVSPSVRPLDQAARPTDPDLIRFAASLFVKPGEGGLAL